MLDRGWLKVRVATIRSPAVRRTASANPASLCSRCSCSVKPGKYRPQIVRAFCCGVRVYMNSWPPGRSTRAAAARNRPRSKWCTLLNAVTRSRLAVRSGSSSAADSSGTTPRPRLPAVSSASIAAETSLASSREPSGSTPRSSREYRPVPQPASRPVTGRSGRNWRIARTGASSVVRSDS